MKQRYLIYIVLTLCVLLIIPIIVIGRAFRMDLIPDKGRNFGCATCHINPAGGGAKNSFGIDWQNIAIPRGDRYVPELANRDSDGDGFTNDEEFNANTHPGNSNSKPAPAFILGDVNGDKNITSADAILALRFAAGIIIPTESQKRAADMNGDGQIRSNDAIAILRKAARL